MAFQTGLDKGRFQQKEADPSEPTIFCTICELDLPESAFEPQRRQRKKSQCGRCRRESMYAQVNASAPKYLAKLYSSLAYNRKKQGYEWTVTVEDFIEQYEKQGGRCALSDIVLTHYRDGGGAKSFNCSIDRVNPKIGYTKKNIQIVAYSVNIMKGTMDEYEFMWWIDNIFRCKVKGEVANGRTEQ